MPTILPPLGPQPAKRRTPASALPGVDRALKPTKRAAGGLGQGLGGQTRAQRQEAGRLGGRHRVERGTGHTWSKAEASAAGKKGRAKQLAALTQQQQTPQPPKAR